MGIEVAPVDDILAVHPRQMAHASEDESGPKHDDRSGNGGEGKVGHLVLHDEDRVSAEIETGELLGPEAELADAEGEPGRAALHRT